MRTLIIILSVVLGLGTAHSQTFEQNTNEWWINGYAADEGENYCQVVTYQPKQISETTMYVYDDLFMYINFSFDYWHLDTNKIGTISIEFDDNRKEFSYTSVSESVVRVQFEDANELLSLISSSKRMVVSIDDSVEPLTIYLDEAKKMINLLRKCLNTL
jgi:hypothetical protein